MIPAQAIFKLQQSRTILTIHLPSERKIPKSQRFFRSSKVAIPSWLRERVQVTDEDQVPEERENVLPLWRERTEPIRGDGRSAIDLVYQAAEVVGNIQNHARQTEIRAETLCRNALDKLRFAETRAQAAENALNVSESRIASVEARLSAA
jgi:hypothetical protein